MSEWVSERQLKTLSGPKLWAKWTFEMRGPIFHRGKWQIGPRKMRRPICRGWLRGAWFSRLIGNCHQSNLQDDRGGWWCGRKGGGLWPPIWPLYSTALGWGHPGLPYMGGKLETGVLRRPHPQFRLRLIHSSHPLKIYTHAGAKSFTYISKQKQRYA